MLSISTLDICLAGAGLYLVQRFLAKSSAPVPPGPSGWPIIGNLLDMPTEDPWLSYSKWAKQHGDITSVELFGRRFIFLNSPKAATDLFDKKGAMYADRPHLTMACDLSGWADGLIFLSSGDKFRRYRKNISRMIGKGPLRAFHSAEEIETCRFLLAVLKSPNDLMAHVRRTAGAVIFRISHGYEVEDDNDPFVTRAEKGMNILGQLIRPGTFLVDIIPALKYVPDWFPGASFKQFAKASEKLVTELVEIPHEFVKEQMAAGIAPNSLTSHLLSDDDLDSEQEHSIKWSAFSMYAGGSDTTVSSVYGFFLAMTLYPEVQAKAQAELDSVVGTDRLPTLEDLPALPYTAALCKEVLRWNVVTPLTSYHVATQDDMYEGYLIPKGSYIFANIWHLLNDEHKYPNPEEFNPERFLGPNPQADPRDFCFGFGRRICPGLHLAEASVFISCAMSLAVFDIRKAVENGVAITPEVKFTDGAICHPRPFKCSITPRSAKAEGLIIAS
ncbi:cytochrome P450 [Hygrophoropsis aurantiaca]|uniref:Cytochrome P450 n=1 Tax=Hygrophoropsis aurantiaca TaxID=72124 RepID=A0ACB8AD69_9AGAM|nr:cytochrome P450 [Hygrophoropsis aurantiaca]